MTTATNEDYRLPPMDPEFTAYVNEKKEIKERIHNHYKLELNEKSSRPKGMITNDMYNRDQWLTITNSTEKKDDKSDFEKFLRSNSDLAAIERQKAKQQAQDLIPVISTFGPSDKKSADPNDKKSTTITEVYEVNSSVGSLIAKKMLRGEKIHVCRNGELVVNSQVMTPRKTSLWLEQKAEDMNKGNELFRILDDTPQMQASPLSWDDQIKKNDVRIIEAKCDAPRTERKPKPERVLIVRKLIDEDDLRPKEKRSPLLKDADTRKKSAISVRLFQNTGEPPLESSSCSSLGSKEDKHFSITNTTAAARGSLLNQEQSYLQIMDNLTSQYAPGGLKRSTSHITPKMAAALAADTDYYTTPSSVMTTTASINDEYLAELLSELSSNKDNDKLLDGKQLRLLEKKCKTLMQQDRHNNSTEPEYFSVSPAPSPTRKTPAANNSNGAAKFTPSSPLITNSNRLASQMEYTSDTGHTVRFQLNKSASTRSTSRPPKPPSSSRQNHRHHHPQKMSPSPKMMAPPAPSATAFFHLSSSITPQKRTPTNLRTKENASPPFKMPSTPMTSHSKLINF